MSERIEVMVGDELFSFPSFENWVNKARARFAASGYTGTQVLAIDARGRICEKGLEFMRARDEGAFPVRVYVRLLQ